MAGRGVRGASGGGWLCAAVLGCSLVLASATLPWQDPDLHLRPAARVTVAVAGALLLVAVAHRHRRATAGAPGGPVVAVGALGGSVLLYPAVLSVGAADVVPGTAGAAVVVVASAFHVVPLTLTQLVPVLAASAVTGRTRRGHERLVVGVAVLGVGVTGLGLAGVPGAPALLVLSAVLWFGSFVLGPVGAWTAVRGAGGPVRLRAVMAGLASLVPLVVITWCAVVGALAAELGLATGDGTTGLLVGFALGCLACGALVLVAVGPADSPALTGRAVSRLLDGILAVLAVVLALAAVLVTTRASVRPAGALLTGVVVAVALGLPWLRLRSWTARVVDPALEFRHELARGGDVTEGHQRQVARQALRRVLGDPHLELVFALPPDRWVGGGGGATPLGDPVVLARGDDGAPTVQALPGAGAARRRLLTGLGDCSAELRPALLEARLEDAASRARRAAAAERSRMSQDLHDGLQGRLLGLALDLQLSGRALDDPNARLLLEGAVRTLRAAVDDVRALAGGRVPTVLGRGGLAEALPALLGPVRGLVALDLRPDRFPPLVEATAYFVVGESVGNALKHAQATRIGVHVVPDGDHLTVTVVDDGIGGADPRLGAGLRGLAERVSAVGGVLVVRGGAPSGTVVEAVLPCGS